MRCHSKKLSCSLVRGHRGRRLTSIPRTVRSQSSAPVTPRNKGRGKSQPPPSKPASSQSKPSSTRESAPRVLGPRQRYIGDILYEVGPELPPDSPRTAKQKKKAQGNTYTRRKPHSQPAPRLTGVSSQPVPGTHAGTFIVQFGGKLTHCDNPQRLQRRGMCQLKA